MRPVRLLIFGRLPFPSLFLDHLQVEKVVLFFLAKQGSLAALLLDARQQAGHVAKRGDSGMLEGPIMDEVALDHHPSSPAARYSVFCDIGRQIAQLMRFLQLNGG